MQPGFLAAPVGPCQLGLPPPPFFLLRVVLFPLNNTCTMTTKLAGSACLFVLANCCAPTRVTWKGALAWFDVSVGAAHVIGVSVGATPVMASRSGPVLDCV